MMWMSSPCALYKNKKRKLAEVCKCSSQCENWFYYGIYATIKVRKGVTENMQVYFSYTVGWKLHVTTVFVNWGFLRFQNTFLKNDKVLLSVMFVWWCSVVSRGLSRSQGMLLAAVRGSGRNESSARFSMVPQVNPLSSSILLSRTMRIWLPSLTWPIRGRTANARSRWKVQWVPPVGSAYSFTSEILLKSLCAGISTAHGLKQYFLI